MHRFLVVRQPPNQLVVRDLDMRIALKLVVQKAERERSVIAAQQPQAGRVPDIVADAVSVHRLRTLEFVRLRG